MTAGASSAIAEVGEDMPGVRKVAVLLMSLDTDRASQVVQTLAGLVHEQGRAGYRAVVALHEAVDLAVHGRGGAGCE